LLTCRAKITLLFVPFFLAALAGCAESSPVPSAETVTVYTSLDQVYSEPLLKDFQERTGIRVQAVYDAEAAKTTGLTNRLIARRDKPDCDVWWNNEPVQTARLAGMGLLAKYESPAAARIPAAYRDPEGRWTGFAARARVLIYNTKMVPAGRRPAGLQDFVAPAWRGKAAVARPFFGTTLTHICILYEAWGPERLREFLLALRANDVALCAGNGPVRDLVAAGEYAFGLTDTDDAHSAMQEGKPVAAVVPDAAAGAVILPNTVALIAGCPHPEAGRKLIDHLLSAEVERRLAVGPSSQIPLGSGLADVRTPWDDLRRAPPMTVDFARVAASVEKVVAILQETGMDR
jgi:iron(III) transport system substrate-binding protein